MKHGHLENYQPAFSIKKQRLVVTIIESVCKKNVDSWHGHGRQNIETILGK